MSLDADQVMQLARRLWQAEQRRQPVPTLSSSHPDLNEADAYRISAAKLALRHRKKTGYKLGYTSEAMRRQMNIDSPNFGVLTDDLLVDGDQIDKLDQQNHQRLRQPQIDWPHHPTTGK